MSLLFEKGPLVAKVWTTIQTGETMARKWCGFCSVHGASSIKPEEQDEAFLITFLEAANGDTIPPHSGELPFEIRSVLPRPAAQASTGRHGFDPEPAAAPALGGKSSAVVPFGGKPFGGKGFGKDDGKGKKGDGKNEAGKVFIGGLPRSATEQSVGSMMLKYGTITKVDVKYGEDELCKGFAFVTFADPGSAEAAIQASAAGQTVLDGKWAICQAAGTPKGEGKGKDDKGKGKGKSKEGLGAMNAALGSWGGEVTQEDWARLFGKGGGGKDFGPKPGKIFVGGLPKTAPESTVMAHFSQYGEVDRILMKYTEYGESRGFCFVEFVDPQVAKDVIAKSQAGHTIFEGKWVHCKEADSNAEKGKKGGEKGFDKGGKGGDDWWGPDAKRQRTDDWGAEWGKGKGPLDWCAGGAGGGKWGGSDKGWGKGW